MTAGSHGPSSTSPMTSTPAIRSRRLTTSLATVPLPTTITRAPAVPWSRWRKATATRQADMVTAQVASANRTLNGGTRSRSQGPTSASTIRMAAATTTVTFQIRRTVWAVLRCERL